MKPILFNTEMVQAILAGRKTTTRRVIKNEFLPGFSSTWTGYRPVFEYGQFFLEGSNHKDATKHVKPKYKPGDILWVRETWMRFGNILGIKLDGYNKVGGWDYIYKADDCRQNPDDRWHPSIHMPREAARLFLRVKSVSAKRLRDMTQEDAEKEGLESPSEMDFAQLWDSTVKPADRTIYGWASNPWVWVIEFERTEAADAT